MRTRFSTIVSLTVATAFVATAPLLGPRTVSAEPPLDPAALFRKSCATCHAIPDPALPMDRAWLDQVNRTT